MSAAADNMAGLADLAMDELAPMQRWFIERVGFDATMELVRIRGGTPLYIPKEMDEELLLVQLIGAPAAAALIAARPGETITVPNFGKAMGLVRNRRIRRDALPKPEGLGLSADALAIRERLHVRSIWRILSGDDTLADNQLDLYS